MYPPYMPGKGESFEKAPRMRHIKSDFFMPQQVSSTHISFHTNTFFATESFAMVTSTFPSSSVTTDFQSRGTRIVDGQTLAKRSDEELLTLEKKYREELETAHSIVMTQQEKLDQNSSARKTCFTDLGHKVRQNIWNMDLPGKISGLEKELEGLVSQFRKAESKYNQLEKVLTDIRNEQSYRADNASRIAESSGGVSQGQSEDGGGKSSKVWRDPASVASLEDTPTQQAGDAVTDSKAYETDPEEYVSAQEDMM